MTISFIRACTCSDAKVTCYQKRISGPLLDRIDIHVEVPRVEYEKLASDRLAESSKSIRKQVEAARARQRVRFKGTKLTATSDMVPAEIRTHCKLGASTQNFLKAATQQLQLSARGYHRVLKLARTIADLAASDEISPTHLAEVVQYRPRGRA